MSSPFPPIKEASNQRTVSVSPLARLPPNCLLLIFRFVAKINVEPFTPTTYIASLHTLAQVSMSWAQFIRTNSALWPLVSDNNKVPEWRAALALSRSRPIEVQYLSPRKPNESSVLFWSEVVKHIDRWKEANICVSEREGLDVLEKENAPQLVRYRMVSSDLKSRPRLNLFGGVSPNLRHLILQDVALRDWGSALTQNLHSLSYVNIEHGATPPPDLAPTVQHLLAIARRCPDLETLTVSGVGGSGQSEPDLAEETIVLPHIQYLDLRDWTDVALCGFLRHISTPNCSALNFSQPSRSQPSSFINAILPYVVKECSPRFAASACITIQFLGRGATISSKVPCSSSLPQVRFSLPYVTPTRDVVDLAIRVVDALQPSTAVPVDFQFRRSSGGNRLSDVISLLPKLPTIKRITLIEDLEGVDALFDVLRLDPTCCPNLEEVALFQTSEYQPENLLALIQSRQVIGQGVTQMSRATVSAGSTMDAETYRAIMEVIGDGVFWDRAPRE